jgi:hypothetical protein
MKRAGSGFAIQWYGSAYPGSYRNFADPEYNFYLPLLVSFFALKRWKPWNILAYKPGLFLNPFLFIKNKRLFISSEGFYDL